MATAKDNGNFDFNNTVQLQALADEISKLTGIRNKMVGTNKWVFETSKANDRNNLIIRANMFTERSSYIVFEAGVFEYNCNGCGKNETIMYERISSKSVMKLIEKACKLIEKTIKTCNK